MGLILEFEDTATLCCQICTGVQGAKSLIGDLMKKKRPTDIYNDTFIKSLVHSMESQIKLLNHV